MSIGFCFSGGRISGVASPVKGDFHFLQLSFYSWF